VGTRRRRDNGHDYAIVRLGTPRIIHGIIVDTPYFKGNYPPFVSIEAARLIDHISVISEISCCAMGSNVLVLNRSARVEL
jgi:allantoicase